MSIAFLYPRFLWLLSLIPVLIGLGLLGQRAQSNYRLWAGLILRTILMVAIILALAGVQVKIPSNELTTTFLLDVSDSVSINDQIRGEEFIRQAIQVMPEGDKAAIIVFGQEALIERLPSEDRLLNDLASIPITSRTDVAGALQLAQAILPEEGAKRIVLLSDGRENIQNAMKQA